MILLKPIVSEKSMKLAGSLSYTFLVGKNATKPQIAKAVTQQFKVMVLGVKTMNVKGEIKMQRRARRNYTTSSSKKAIVQIKKGQVIPIFEAPKETVVTTAEGEPEIKEKRNLLRGTKVKVEKSQVEAAPTTQRKIIAGKGNNG